MSSPLTLAPSTTVLPMPLAVCFTPGPTEPLPICLAPCSTCLVAWSTLVLPAAPATPQPRTATARKAGATHNARICRVRVMASLLLRPVLTEPQIPQNEQDHHDDTDDVEDVVHGSLLSGATLGPRSVATCSLPLGEHGPCQASRACIYWDLSRAGAPRSLAAARSLKELPCPRDLGPKGSRMPGSRRTRDDIRISNRATYWPVAPLDLVVAAPLVARVLFRATPIGRVLQAATLGAYLASALRDWHDRRGIRTIAFRHEFGADLHHLVPMPREGPETQPRTLAERLTDELTLVRIPRRELAGEVDRP